MPSRPDAHEPAIAFVGYLASHERVLADPTLSLADNRMQRGYVTALAEQYADLTVFSTVPSTSDQGAATLEANDNGIVVRHLGTMRGRIRTLRKPFALARELDRWARTHRGRPTVLLHYNTFLLYVVVASWLRRRHGTRVVPIAITMPYRTPDGQVSVSARIQDRISAWFLGRVDGIVAITPFLTTGLAPGVPHLVVRGGVDEGSLGHRPPPDGVAAHVVRRPARIVYAGNLTPRYHLDAAIAMMAHLPVDNYVLDIYGRGVLEADVRAAAESTDNIRFHGAVDESAVGPLLRDADVLLALLTPDDAMARLTFPSKLFESLASGTPTLTTDLPTLDGVMRDQLVVVTDLSPKQLAATVSAVCARSGRERAEAAAGADKFLREQGTWSAVGRRLRPFLDALEARVR